MYFVLLLNCCSVFSVPNVQSASPLALKKKGILLGGGVTKPSDAKKTSAYQAVTLPFSAMEMPVAAEGNFSEKEIAKCCEDVMIRLLCGNTVFTHLLSAPAELPIRREMSLFPTG